MSAPARPFKQPVSVLVIIHTAEQEILLLERAAFPGYWQSVTGSREGSESLRETAIREVFEETGLTTEAYTLSDWNITNRFRIFEQWRHRYAPGVIFNDEHVFGLELPNRQSITLAPDEHRASIWLPLEAAIDRCFSWSNRDALRLLQQRFRNASLRT